MYFNETNKESFRLSIIDVLNSTDSKLRINDELLRSFMEEVIEPEVSLLSPEEALLNPIILKLSKDTELYKLYAKDIIKLKHSEYIEKLHALIGKHDTKVFDYALNNIDLVDFNNELESSIMSSFTSHILEHKLFHLVWQRFFIKYVIYSSTNLRPSVNGYSFSYYLKKRNKNLNFKLTKFSKYNNYCEYPVMDYYNGSIYINLGLFKVISDIKGFEAGLLFLLNNCFKYLTKYIKVNKENSNIYDLEMYRFMKEEIIYKEDSKFYNKNQNYFDRNIEIFEESQRLVSDLLNNPLFSKFNIKNFIKIDYNQFKNTSNYYNVDEYLDNLIYSAPSIIGDYPMLRMEYNNNGKRKSVQELVVLKNDKKHNLETQLIEINKAINESANNKLLEKKNSIESGIKGVLECHNNMIYKAVKSHDVASFKRLLLSLSEKEKTSVLESIRQEKNTFINKISNNRKNISKNSIFLENDEFLSNEYKKAAIYESAVETIKEPS